MENIQLRRVLLLNRFNEKRFLQEIEPYVFKIDGDTDFMRVIYSDKGDIEAIDPPGGPFMSIGKFITSRRLYIKSIGFNKDTGDFLIYTEN